MKKILAAALLLAASLCTNAWGSTIYFQSVLYGSPDDLPQMVPNADGFTLSQFSSFHGSTPALLLDNQPTVTYNHGLFNYSGAKFLFTPWDMGGSESLFYDNTPFTLTLTFKNASGTAIATENLYMDGFPTFSTQAVAGVHEIDFSANSAGRLPRLISLDMTVPQVPEPATYVMLGVGLLLLLRRAAGTMRG